MFSTVGSKYTNDGFRTRLELFQGYVDCNQVIKKDDGAKTLSQRIAEVNDITKDRELSAHHKVKALDELCLDLERYMAYPRPFLMQGEESAFIRAASLVAPDWESHRDFKGLDFDGTDYCLDHDIMDSAGKTSGALVIKRKDWMVKPSGASKGLTFIVGITRCDILDLEGVVSSPTKQKASPEDNEVFDAVHELGRIYGGDDPVVLGFVRDMSMRTGRALKEDVHNVKQRVSERLKSSADGSSKKARIFIASEVKDLNPDTVKEIFEEIDIRHFTAIGVDELDIDFVSCFAADLTKDGLQGILDYINEISVANNMKIKLTMPESFVYNNISFCYANIKQCDRALSFMEREEALPPVPLSSLEITPIQNDKGTKKVVQVMNPGFRFLGCKPGSQERYVTTKKLVAYDGATKVSKHLIRPGVAKDIPKGMAVEYVVDGRSDRSKRSLKEEGDHRLDYSLTSKDEYLAVLEEREKLGRVLEPGFMSAAALDYGGGSGGGSGRAPDPEVTTMPVHGGGGGGGAYVPDPSPAVREEGSSRAKVLDKSAGDVDSPSL